ncbi:MAG: MurR/RpiR family transcriptional regulator, partial [Anaerolineae bacterium]
MVLETLRRVYPELTPAQQVLADYVTRSYREVAFMTAARVAEAVAMNEATVIRFAQRLGYEGYPEMQAAIQEAVLAELEGPQPTAEPQSFVEIFRASLVRCSERTGSMATLISTDAVERAITMLATASDVLVIGVGEGATLGEHLVRQLRALGLRLQAVSGDPSDLAHALAKVRPGDVVIGCGGADGSTAVAAALKAAKTLGART